MNTNKLTALAAAALLVGGMALVAAPTAHANPLEPMSWGAANMISYADSDFEGGIGNWVAYSNTTLSDDTTTAFLHHDSLKMVATNSGSQAAKMGSGTSARQVNVTGGDTYRESAWVKASANSGRTITFADRFYNSAGDLLGWTSGSAVTLNNSGKWQYVRNLIKAPSTAAYMLGSPRITEAGVSAGEVLHVDEVLVEPYRAATIIGAKDPSTDASQFFYANSQIGPLQSDKLFYDDTTSLPSSYSASNCANLPSTVTCVLAYKVQNTNVQNFVRSIPAGQNVIMVWWQEPEAHLTASNFKSGFEAQANLIRSSTTSSNVSNVFVAMDSGGYPYRDGGSAINCDWIVPPSYTDFYFMDHYESPANGQALPNSGDNNEWSNWLACTAPQNKPIGLAEYGLNCPTTNTPNAPTTYEAIDADKAYLKGESFVPTGQSTVTRPVVLWEYWWYNQNGQCQFTTGGSPDGTRAVQAWQSAETQNGGGAN